MPKTYALLSTGLKRRRETVPNQHTKFKGKRTKVKKYLLLNNNKTMSMIIKAVANKTLQ